jgi:hypothetical protein
VFNLNIFKPKHVHSWELIACNDEYTSKYTDTGKIVEWQQRFYKCSCGDRHHTDNRPYSQTPMHKGIDTAKQNWIDLGVVPTGSYVPGEANGYYKITDAERKELDPVMAYQQTLKDMVDSLGVVIKRDFKLEEKYPDLRDAANKYHQILDQYRVMEILKGEKENN